jgi:hypothetical protein
VDVPESPAETAGTAEAETGTVTASTSSEGPEPIRKRYIRVGGAVLTAPYRKLLDAITEGVYWREERVEHLASIKESTPHDYLYACLGILDTKAAALLQFDGIIIAASTVAVTFFPRASVGNPLVVTSLILAGISSVLCLQVVWVYWTKTAEFAAEEEDFAELLRCRNRRTVFYRCSWLIAQVSVFFLVLGVILRQG